MNNMNCSERDPDILLLQHGELNGWRRLATLHHLRTCPRCQEKQEQYAQAARHIVGAFRQEAGLPPFAFPATPTLTRTPPSFSDLRAHSFRPALVATVTAVAAVIAAGAYVYKAMALTPEADDSLRVVQATNAIDPKASPSFLRSHCTDASGRPTIFPYSTPVMDDHHGKETGHTENNVQ